LKLGFAVAPCSEQPPRPSQILSNDAMTPSSLAFHFHSKQGRADGGDGLSI